MPPVATTQTPRPAAVEPRAPGNEQSGNIGIWTGVGTLGDTGNATAPGSLTITTTLTVTGASTFNNPVTLGTAAAPTADEHVVPRKYVEDRVQAILGGAGYVPEAPDALAVYGRKGGATPSWDAAVPLAGGVTMTGTLTIPTLTVSTALNLPGGETVASQTWVNGAITTALGTALTVAALRALLDSVYVRREGA